MANQSCTNCGARMARGQKICSICGGVPQVSSSAPAAQQPMIIHLGGDQQGKSWGFTEYAIISVILVIVAFMVWPDKSQAFINGAIPTAQALIDQINKPGLIKDETGKVTGCAQGGTFVAFDANGNPNFLDPDGTMNDLIPVITTTPVWFCFEPSEWSAFLSRPGVFDAMVKNIMNHSGLKGEQWKKAVEDALNASKHSSYLILPSKSGQILPTMLPLATHPNGGNGGNSGGNAATQTPVVVSPTPTNTQSPQEAELANYSAILTEMLPGVSISGDADALFVLNFGWSEFTSLTGQAAVMPRLSPEGGFYGNMCLWSQSYTLENKHVFKACLSVPASVAGGTWVQPYNFRWNPVYSQPGSNTWAKDPNGNFEGQEGVIWFEGIFIPTPKPFIPAATATMDFVPIMTMIPEVFPTAIPTVTYVPVEPSIGYAAYINTIPSDGQYALKIATCFQYAWPNSEGKYVASCQAGGVWSFVDWSINQLGDTALYWQGWTLNSGLSQYPSSCKQQLGSGPWFACPK